MYNPFHAELMATEARLRDSRHPSGNLATEALRRDLEVRRPAATPERRWSLNVGRIRFEMQLAGSR